MPIGRTRLPRSDGAGSVGGVNEVTGRWTSDVGGNLFLDDELVGTFESAYTAECVAAALNGERLDPAGAEPTAGEVNHWLRAHRGPANHFSRWAIRDVLDARAALIREAGWR